MSTSAKADVRISFTTDRNPSSVEKIVKFCFDANEKKLTGDYEGDYDITIGEEGYSHIMLHVYSTRFQNLDWQLDRIRDFIYPIDDVCEMYCDVWVQGEGPYFNKG